MRRPEFASGLVPRVAALVSILALAGCSSGGGGTNQDSGTGGHTGAGGHVGSGGSGGGGSGGSASGGAGGSLTDAGTGGMTGAGGAAGMSGAGGAAGMSGAGGGTGGQMDAGMDTLTGAGGDMDAGMDVPADTGAGGVGGDMDAGDTDAADGSADAGTLATGVEMVSVPLATTGTGQRYIVQNRTSPDMPYNLSGQTLTIRAYAPGAIGGDMSVFFRSSVPVDGAATGSVDSMATKVGLSTLTSGFTDVPITVPAAAGGFDPTMVDIIRIEIEADAAFGATFRTPATLVFFDSIISSNGAVMLPFDVAAVANDFGNSGARAVAGSTGPTFQATFP